MAYQIDQSGKIEQTEKDTVIAYSNGTQYAAKDVFDKKKRPDRVLKLPDIIKAIKKTDGRLRECLSTLVDAQTRSSKKRLTHKSKKVKRKDRVRR